MLPVVAIVGRPNVGKSTLFNCLTSSRAALVSDFPGLTRDRQYGEADIAGRRFIAIDTGGMTQTRNALEKLTVDQAIQAVKEANKILFVVDARAGITTDDLLIIKKLRALKKPIFLAANKAEGLDMELGVADFYSLGLGKPYAISAAHHRGTDDLIQDMFEKDELAVSAADDTPAGIRLAFVGRPNAGKSTLINRLLGEERLIVSDQPGTTRDSIFIPLARHGKHYMLIDTAGVRRRGKVFETVEKFSVVKTLQAIEAAHVILFMIDARESVTDQDLRLLGFILETGKALVIALNKWDNMTDTERDNARQSIDRRLGFVSFARTHYISALHGSGVGHLFDSIDEAYASATKKLATPQLTKILREAVTTHIPPLVQGHRVKLRYAHAGGHNPPRIVIHGNQVHALPGAYKRYLANVFQERLSLVGTPVQIELRNSENPYVSRQKAGKKKKDGVNRPLNNHEH